MICQNCRAVVDDDLIFCVECGSRLTGGFSTDQIDPAQPTVAFSNSSAGKKKKNRLFLIALLAFVGVGVVFSAVGLFLWAKSFSEAKRQENDGAIEKNVNSGKNDDRKNENILSNDEKTGRAENSAADERVIVDDTLTIEKNDHRAFPFEITDDSTMMRGQAELLDGDSFQAYILLKEAYDTFTAEPSYKIWGFSGKRGEIVKINEFTTAEKFVLILENKTDKPINLKIKIFLKKVQ